MVYSSSYTIHIKAAERHLP